MTKEEALKLSMEAMEITGGFDVEINAIKEALAQPEQEPVAFSCLRCVTPKKCAIHGCSPNTWPSETLPPQRKPLTDEEIETLWPLRPTDEIVVFARAIEAAHGIKGEA